MKALGELAKVLRSKNSGPFELTIDVLFADEACYRRVKQSGVLTRETIMRLYSVPASDITVLEYFDAALGIKITMHRSHASGSVHDRDVYGAQQHAPLLGLIIP